jgi:DNA-binding LacI/PurR family transcriptional regulator
VKRSFVIIPDLAKGKPQEGKEAKFDDIAFAGLTQPPPTTVSLSRVQLAVTALPALEQLIRRASARKIEYRITTHLVVRQSTRAI